MCEIRGCDKKGVMIFYFYAERTIKKRKKLFLECIPVKKMICMRCFKYIINNRKINQPYWEVNYIQEREKQMTPIPRDYKDYPKPRMFSHEIIIEMRKRGIKEFTSSEVAEMFDIELAEACTRINVLKRYGCVRIMEPKTYPRVYEITSWGYKYANGREKK